MFDFSERFAGCRLGRKKFLLSRSARLPASCRLNLSTVDENHVNRCRSATAAARRVQQYDAVHDVTHLRIPHFLSLFMLLLFFFLSNVADKC